MPSESSGILNKHSKSDIDGKFIQWKRKLQLKRIISRELSWSVHDVASWNMLLSLWSNLIKIVLIHAIYPYSKSSGQNLFISVYSTLIFVYRGKPKLKLECCEDKES